jgi:hypothetical protein
MEEREMLKNALETLKSRWGRSPFYSKSKYGHWGKISAKPVKSRCLQAMCRSPGEQPGKHRAYDGIPPREGFRLSTGAHWAQCRATRCTGRCCRVEIGLPVKSLVTLG